MKKSLKMMCLLTALILGVAGCGGNAAKDDKKAAAPQKKELVVGTAPSFAPFEFPSEEADKPTGFDMELIEAIGKKMGYEKVTIKGMGFDALIPAMNAGNIDVIISGMSITDARKKQVLFTDPYYESGLMVIVKKDNNEIKSFDDLKGKRIGVQLGTTGAQEAEKIEGAKVTNFDTSDLACIELKNGNVDAVISDLPVLRGVDLTVEKGDVVAILGPSGSGKTTLLRCLNFLETADAGQLVFDGESFDLAHASRTDIARLRKKTAFVFQNYNLFRNKTALQNVTEGLIVARKLPKEQADEIGMKMLAKVGLADRADYYPRQLSGGQQQRVAIARALAADPEIIYFDEPTSALDPELTGEVLSVMRQLAEEGMTMLVVTHEMGFARNVSSKTVFMENGVVVEQAPSQQFFASPKEERTRAFLRRIAHTE